MDHMKNMTLQAGWSRRNFLQGAVAFAVVPSALAVAHGEENRLKAKKTLAYVGSYTGAIGGGGNGEGIYCFEMNEQSGELMPRGLVAKTPNPSWIAIHPSRKYLYAANEVADFQGNSGSVSAFAIDAASGELKALNTVSSEGAGPAHLSVDASGKFVFVANYGGGSISVLHIHEDGSLGAAADIHRDKGSVGAAQATHAPLGSFAVSGHDAPHAHMIAPDPQNRFVLATDLGQDRIYSYGFDAGSGKLTPVSFASLPTGDGPRHFAFHPNGHWLYAIQEEASTISFFQYDAATGSLAAQQTVSALPAGFAGSSFASEVLVSPNGRFLYAANRLHDSITVFAIDAHGELKQVGEASTLGDYPGQCRIDPSGRFLYVCNRRSDNITLFRIDSETGVLTFTGRYTPAGSPASITFLSLI
jgi:6-phosphogluconolactonase (cycloisomerase 2 family)